MLGGIRLWSLICRTFFPNTNKRQTPTMTTNQQTENMSTTEYSGYSTDIAEKSDLYYELLSIPGIDEMILDMVEFESVGEGDFIEFVDDSKLKNIIDTRTHSLIIKKYNRHITNKFIQTLNTLKNTIGPQLYNLLLTNYNNKLYEKPIKIPDTQFKNITKSLYRKLVECINTHKYNQIKYDRFLLERINNMEYNCIASILS